MKLLLLLLLLSNFATLLLAQTIKRQIACRYIHDELKGIWKDAVLVSSCHLSGQTVRNSKETQSGQSAEIRTEHFLNTSLELYSYVACSVLCSMNHQAAKTCGGVDS
jgi:hypothetical protein